MADFDGEVTILTGLTADESSAHKTGKTLAGAVNDELQKVESKISDLSDKEYDSEKRLESLDKSRVQLSSRLNKLYAQKEALQGKNTKAVREERDALEEAIGITNKKLAENSADKSNGSVNLRAIQSEISAVEELRKSLSNGQKEVTGTIVEYSDIESQWIDALDKMYGNLGEFVENTANSVTSSGERIRRTASQIKEEVQGIISTMSQQPSTDFTKQENAEIKQLQKNLADAMTESKTLEDKLTGEPWRLQVDIRDAEQSLGEVTKAVAEQEAEVKRLESAYAEAEARASEIANSLQSGNYSQDEFTLAVESLKGADRDVERIKVAYDEAKDALTQLINKQTELENTIDDTTDKYNNMVAALKSDDHESVNVSTNEPIVEQYQEANAEVDRLKESLDEVYITANQNNIVKQEDLEVARILREELQGIGNEVRNIVETGSITGPLDTEVQAAKENDAAIKAQIKSLNAQAAAVRQSASQYYYMLRAVKMASYVINNATNTINKFGKTTLSVATNSLQAYLKLIPGVNSLVKALNKSNSSQKRWNREIKATTKAHDGLNLSIKDLVKNLLKYGLGIRSVFVLFNRLRTSVQKGFGDMAQVFDPVNKSLSSISTSLLLMRNAVTAAVEPLIHLLAPILERISALLAQASYMVASFIAALTGRSTVIRATRAQVDYAKSLDGTAKSAKKAKKELAGFDELNVLHTDDDSDNGMPDPSAMFEEVPIDSIMADWADKFKKFLDRLFAPIKKAWEKTKAYVINNFKYMLNQLRALGASVAKDFWKVWEEAKTQKIFEDMFLILGDIELTIGVLAKKFREAWEYNENGYRILAAIRDIIYEIVHHIRRATLYTAEWAESLNFKPLLTAIADVLEKQIVPAVRRIMDLLEYLYEKIFLELLKDLIQNTLPTLTRALGYIVGALGSIAKHIEVALDQGNKGEKIVGKIEYLISIVAGAIEDCAEKTKEWADNLRFTPLVESTYNFLDKIAPLVQFIADTFSKFWNNVLLPFYEYLIEDGLPKLLDTLGKIFGQFDEETGMGIDWEKLSTDIDTFMEALEPFFELAWETIIQLINDLGKAFDDFVNSGALTTLVEHFKDWVEDADPEELASKIEKLTGVFIGIAGAFNLFSKVILPVVTSFMTLQNLFKQGAMASQVAKISDDVAKLAGTSKTASGGISSLTTKFSGLLQNLDLVHPEIMTIGSSILGVVSVIGGSILAIANFSDMMQEGFSAGREAAMLLGIAIAAVGAIILGAPVAIAAAVAAIVAIIANFVIAIQTMPEEFAQKINEIGDFIGSIPERIEGILSTILDKVKEFGHNLGVKVGEIIANAPAKFKEWKDNLLVFIQKVEWGELGLNILKGILSIFLLPARLLVFIVQAIGNFIKSFIDGLKEGFDMHSPSKKMEPYGKNILEGILQGIKSAISSIGSWIVNNIATPILNGIKSAFGIVGDAASKLKTIGGNLMTGLKNGISDKFSTVKTNVTNYNNQLMSLYKNHLSPSALIATGHNLLAGLTNGMLNGLSKAYDAIRNGCNNIVNIAKNVFKIGSPSKVFAEIGEYNMEGLSNGIEDGASDVGNVMEDAMDNLIPENEISTDFADTFLDRLTSMKQDAVDIITSMANEMQASILNIENMFSALNLQSQFNKLSYMPVPSIAQGQVLPSMSSFSPVPSNDDSINKLSEALSNAIIEAFGNTSYNNTDNSDTVIQIDGSEVFRAVRNQNRLYRNSTGKSAF